MGTSYQEIILKLWNLTKLVITVNGMMQQRIQYAYEVTKMHEKAQFDKEKKVINAPQFYHKIGAHLVFAAKYDDRHKLDL